ncbi:restriction endonuclease subunit S [Burkholderia thailandensis]|uniref:restriction endonuclease subunit S n=1 Tax=Burkholderia TaxID=32008 RepID=UPI00217E91E7|nr:MULTISPECIES: restriction endonuclease subunit S [Burkholderia]MCS6479758.1 restriction endonuclease subunit S [Burkholderia thailandensis]MDN7815879.1 restriction endonuclease subunit S [Burkholderia vietnamiensis]
MSSEWPIRRLGDVIHVKHGFAFKSEFFSEQRTQHQLVTPGNFAIGGGFQLGKGKYYCGEIPEEYVLKKGDLVVTMTDLSRGADTLGYAAIVPEVAGTTWLHNQRIGLVQNKDESAISLGYLHYLMRSPKYRHWVVSTATGSTVKHTAPSRICGFEFACPSLGEQTKIATILDTLEGRITLLRETNATLEAIAKALFKSWFVDFDPVRAKREERAPEGMDEATAALFPDGFQESELGPVPRGWQLRPVYELATYINGAAYKAFEPNGERRGLPIVKIAELKSGVAEQTAYSDVSMPEKYRIRRGDILFSWSGNPDTSIDTFVWYQNEAWLNQHIFRVLPHRTQERAFVLQLLRHLRPTFAELARNKQTTGLGHVTVADMKRLMVVCPDEKLIELFSKSVGSIHARIFENNRQASVLSDLQATILPRLISGQLCLREAEAEVLAA